MSRLDDEHLNDFSATQPEYESGEPISILEGSSMGFVIGMASLFMAQLCEPSPEIIPNSVFPAEIGLLGGAAIAGALIGGSSIYLKRRVQAWLQNRSAERDFDASQAYVTSQEEVDKQVTDGYVRSGIVQFYRHLGESSDQF